MVRRWSSPFGFIKVRKVVPNGQALYAQQRDRERIRATDHTEQPSSGEHDPFDPSRRLVSHDEEKERLHRQGEVPEHRTGDTELDGDPVIISLAKTERSAEKRRTYLVRSALKVAQRRMIDHVLFDPEPKKVLRAVRALQR